MVGRSVIFRHSVSCFSALRGVNYLPTGMRSKSMAFPFRYRQHCQHCFTSDICSSMLSDVLCLEIGVMECIDGGSDLSIRDDALISERSGSLAHWLCFYKRCLCKRSCRRVCSGEYLFVVGYTCLAPPQLSAEKCFSEDARRDRGIPASAQPPSSETHAG